eukprot:CCRYP_008341-RA/>CCRYP_008341-RA protein AED:0.47 eAED:0.46 QI:0/0/0/1/0/0/2/0/90
MHQRATTPCPHCNKKHLKPKKCWELEANQASRPKDWKSNVDSGATSNFIKSATGMHLTGPSSKLVSTVNGHVMRATMTALLPLVQLKGEA